MQLLDYIILLLIFQKVHSEEKYCTAENVGSCGEKGETNMYTRASNKQYHKYLLQIQNAEKQYVPCNATKCECFREVITRDLKPFRKKGINKELINAAKTRGTFYQIIGGKLYRDKDCMFPSRCAGIEHFLLKMIANLSDMDLVVNTRDYPQSNKHFGAAIPVFSFSKTAQYYDIMYPAWAFWEGGPAIALYPRGLGRWDEHRLSLDKASVKTPWREKKNKAFFRGSRTSSERDNLILLSRSKSHLIDAQYTRNQAWKSDEDTLHVPPASEVPLESHCEYKYLFNYRGVAASFRHKHLFLCKSLVFHVGDEWTEFYYDAMKPWVHYIPVPKDASQKELEELIQFTKDNDDLSEKIAITGRDFIWYKLRMTDVICFWRRLLKSYAKLLTYKPVLDKNLVRIVKK